MSPKRQPDRGFFDSMRSRNFTPRRVYGLRHFRVAVHSVPFGQP